MAVLDKCGFGESDQEGAVKTVQDFALDVYNNLCGEEKQINAKTVELFVCDYIMQFLVSMICSRRLRIVSHHLNKS